METGPGPTIEQIRTALRRPLPGVAAQRTMAPQPRAFSVPMGADPRRAAVLLLLYEKEPERPAAGGGVEQPPERSLRRAVSGAGSFLGSSPASNRWAARAEPGLAPGSPTAYAGELCPRDGPLHLALTLRPAHLGHHAGQVSFPGGGWEAGDATLQVTALREACEELGICGDDLEMLGALTPLYVPPSNNLVHPFVAYSPERPAFRPDPAEVAELLEVPLAHFLDARQRREETWTRDGAPLQVPYFAVGPHKVWGATAIILAEFAAVVG